MLPIAHSLSLLWLRLCRRGTSPLGPPNTLMAVAVWTARASTCRTSPPLGTLLRLQLADCLTCIVWQFIPVDCQSPYGLEARNIHVGVRTTSTTVMIALCAQSQLQIIFLPAPRTNLKRFSTSKKFPIVSQKKTSLQHLLRGLLSIFLPFFRHSWAQIAITG